MLVIVGFRSVTGMIVVMFPVSAGVIVVMHPRARAVNMLMFVFMKMFMNMAVGMFVFVCHPVVGVFVHMGMIMFMCVKMFVFMDSVHFSISFHRI